MAAPLVCFCDKLEKQLDVYMNLEGYGLGVSAKPSPRGTPRRLPALRHRPVAAGEHGLLAALGGLLPRART